MIQGFKMNILTFVSTNHSSKMIVLAFFLSTILNISCDNTCEKVYYSQILILFDFTDKEIVEKSRLDINNDIKNISKKFFPCLGCKGGGIKIVQIRDNCQNKSILNASYQPLSQDVSPSEILPEDYTSFKRKLKEAGLQIASDSAMYSLGKTCLYEPLCKEMSLFITDEQPNYVSSKILILYSDMLENNNGISLYVQESLTSNEFEEKMINKYKMKLPNLDKVKIYIVNHRNVKNDDKVRYACQLWAELFEKHGAEVVGPLSELSL